jgi:hypothetical protein
LAIEARRARASIVQYRRSSTRECLRARFTGNNVALRGTVLLVSSGALSSGGNTRRYQRRVLQCGLSKSTLLAFFIH